MTRLTQLSLIAPCFNEDKNIPLLVKQFCDAAQQRHVPVEIVLVDDGSTDETWVAIQVAARSCDGTVVPVRHGTNMGIPAGWISGVDAAKSPVVCLIDADLQNPPEAVFDLYDRFLAGECDLVRGVRRPVTTQPISRVIMSRALNSLLNLVFGMRSKDNKSGFILGNRSTVAEVIKHRGTYRHFQTFVGVSANALDLRVEEIDTAFLDRRQGHSFLIGRSRRVIFEVFRDIPEAVREFGWRWARKNKEDMYELRG